jgi:hypothetical protein
MNGLINFKLPGIKYFGLEIFLPINIWQAKIKTILINEDGFYFTRKKRVNQLLFLQDDTCINHF